MTRWVLPPLRPGISYASPTPRSACVWGGEGSPWARRMLRPGRHLYEGGLGTRGPSPLTHTTPYPIPRGRSRIALYNRLFTQSIVTRRRGMGYKIPSWGKGLTKIYKRNRLLWAQVLFWVFKAYSWTLPTYCAWICLSSVSWGIKYRFMIESLMGSGRDRKAVMKNVKYI